MPSDLVTVVVITHRAAAFITECLDGLAAQTLSHQLIVIDNDSTDGTAELLAARLAPGSVHRMPINLGFAGGVAAALPLIGTPYFALLNDDAVPDPNWLAELVAAAAGDSSAAAWSSLMVLAEDPDTVNNLGVALNERWYGIDVAAGRQVTELPTAVSDVFGFCGGAALVRRTAVLAVGGFPAEFFLYYEDLETSWRLRRAGWSIRSVPTSRVVHRHGATSNKRSALFHFYNERNRLLTLIRCAPPIIAPAELVRFLLTTCSLAIGSLLRRVPDEENFRLGLRLRVIGSVIRMSPGQYRQRRAPSGTRKSPGSTPVG